jgi:hypothetical protein
LFVIFAERSKQASAHLGSAKQSVSQPVSSFACKFPSGSFHISDLDFILKE